MVPDLKEQMDHTNVEEMAEMLTQTKDNLNVDILEDIEKETESETETNKKQPQASSN